MGVWWASLTALEQVYAILAIPATVILMIQTALLLIGGVAGHGDAHGLGDGHDVDAHDLHLDGHVDAHDLHLDGHVDAHDLHLDGHVDAHELHLDGHADAQDVHSDGHDHSDGGLRLFTLRGFVGFFVVLGWSGLSMLRGGMPVAASIALSLVFGFLSMLGIAAIMKSLLKLQQDGTLDLKNAVGQQADVYLTIPPRRSGTGKVTLIVQERLIECDAATDDAYEIHTGDRVKVAALEEGGVLLVRRCQVR